MRAFVRMTAAVGSAAACAAMAWLPMLAQRREAPGLILRAPIDAWDEAIPLGNGLMGALLWGDGQTVKLSLGRGDLWDLRRPAIVQSPEWTYATMRRLRAEGNQAEMVRLFDAPYDTIPYPTRLPAGRIEIGLPAAGAARDFSLDVQRAEGRLTFEDGRALTAFVHADLPVVLVRLPVRVSSRDVRVIAPAAVSVLGYDPASAIDADGVIGYVQRGALGLEYGILAQSAPVDDGTLLAATVFVSRNGPSQLATAKAALRSALATGYAAAFEAHARWWSQFQSTSTITIPDERLQLHYDLVKYFYGAASRIGAPPMPLQGVWTADNGRLPPWKGDYHHDLNTQMTYSAYQTAGLFPQGESFLRFMSDLLPAFRTFARTFHGVDGAVVPGVMTLDGQAMGGWGQYSLSPTNSAWIAHLFARHWRYTGDRAFLQATAYPFCEAVATALSALLAPGDDGRLRLPMSTSPEMFDNSMRAWLTPMSSYDLALVREAFLVMEEFAIALGRSAEAARWRALAARLPAESVDDTSGGLLIAPGVAPDRSHRHFSHALAVYPLGHYDATRAADRRLVHATLDTLAAAGTRQWVGYSFSWFAAMAARAGRAEDALLRLRQFERSFTLRNGFHANGEQTNEGLSAFRYRPFTLEGNFLAMEAIHEMLLQSHGGLVRLFPAVPAEWKDVSFDRLRAEGGFIVSADRRGGQTIGYRIEATVDAALRWTDPFTGAQRREFLAAGQAVQARRSARP